MRNFNRFFRELSVMSLCTLLLITPEVQGAKPGGVAVLLPPFVPILPATPFLFPTSPFAITGFIQSATVTNAGDIFSGGTVTLNGIVVTIPKNTIFQMPAATMTWQEMFANAPAPYKALGQTGLALSDTPPPLTTYEITINGNRIITATTDQYIAGLVFISQQSANTGQGYINAIDYSHVVNGVVIPEMLVSKTLGSTTGARVRINTPNGRYGTADPTADIRFAADEDNPTVSARSGYPMCLPRVAPPAVDSLCPQWNRPRDGFTGAYSSIFTMAPAAAGAPDANGVTHQTGYATGTQTTKPDPFEQAPFEVGDYLTYAGSMKLDASGSPYISAHTISADLGIFTAPGTWPVYVTIEDERIFVGGVRNPIFPLEGQEKIFGDAFTTDSSQLVDVYGVDVNPCTGARTHRFYMSSDPFGPPLGGLKGRARFRATIGNFLPATREMSVASRSLTNGAPVDSIGPLKLTANGLAAGVFQAPQFTFIFPENLAMGSQQIALTFEEFPFLASGSGPYTPFNAGPTTPSAGVMGPLTPFPSPSQPPANCLVTGTFYQPPVANAGSPQTVPSGSTVNLDGSASTDPNGQPLIYTWIQSVGPPVTLLNANAAKPQFVAPTLAPGSTPAVMTFQLAACNGFTCGGLATVNVTVQASTGGPQETLSVDKSNPLVSQVVTMKSNATGGAPGPKTFTFTQIAGPIQTGLKQFASVAGSTELDTETFTATLPAGTPLPSTLTFQCTVTDSALNTATATVNVFVGSDTITPTNVVYSLSKSRLQIAMTDNALPKGAAIITVTPMVNGVPISADIVATYDPALDGYNILAAIINPIPDSVRIRSNYGANIVTPITRIR